MHAGQTIFTRDGTKLWINCFTPDEDNGKVLVIAPAAGISHEFYYLFSSYFCQQGFTVINFDYRGIGKSAPPLLVGYEATLHEWAAQDVNAVLLYAKQNFNSHEIIYVGHSISGEIIGLAPASQYIDKLVLVSSALSCEKLFPWYRRIALKYRKFRGRTISRFIGFVPGNKIRQKIPRGVYTQMANWCDNPNGLFDAFPDNNYRKICKPVLAYTFADDWMCPPKAVRELLNHFTNACITWHHIKPKEIGLKEVGHYDFFYPNMKSKLWESLLKWLNKDDRHKPC